MARRGEQRLVARVARQRPETISHEPPQLREDASYLITGGLGSLGLRAARFLVDSGARHLVLLGRKGLPARPTWDSLSTTSPFCAAVTAIRDFEQRGASVRVEAVEVADAAAMTAVFARLDPPLRGVIHAAGDSTLGPIEETTRQETAVTLSS